MPERIWLGRFNIVGGQGQEDGPYASVSANRTVAESVADLYVVLQPSRSDRDGLCAEALQAASRMFGRAQYSATGNLLLALSAAHQRLRDWNRTSLPSDQMVLGVSCMTLVGRHAYLAQAGAATVFFRRNGRLDRLVPEEAEAQAGLGEADTLAPWFHRLALERGDQVLLLTGALGRQLDDGAVEQWLAQGSERGIGDLFRYARGGQDCGAILIDVLEDLPEDDGGYVEAETVFRRASAPLPPRGDRLPSPEEPLPEPPRDGERPRRWPSPLGRNPFRRIDAAHPDAGAGVLRVMGSALPREEQHRPAVVSAAPQALLAAPAGMSLRVGSRQPSFRSSFGSLSGRRRSLRLPLLGAGVVALLVLGLWLGVPALINSGRTQQFQSLLNTAQTDINQAQRESDLSKRRELLKQAQSSAAEAAQLKPGDQRAQAAASSASSQLGVMDAVQNLPSVPQIADLSSAGSAAGISSSSAVEVASGDRYYVLDVAAGKVLGVTVAEGAQPTVEVVYEQGATVDGVSGGKALHIAWQPSSAPNVPGTLLILDVNRHLFGLSRGDLRSIPLRGVEQWRAASAMALSGNNLYVLDAPAGLVWRYQPSADGFDTDPAPAVARNDIRDATRMSVVGGIFLVGQNQQIRRFLDGQETPFKLDGIDRPPASPEPPLFDPTTGLLYIADRGNNRIVVLQGDGRFQRQLVHADLAGLRGLALDTANRRLVGVIGQSLVAIPLSN